MHEIYKKDIILPLQIIGGWWHKRILRWEQLWFYNTQKHKSKTLNQKKSSRYLLVKRKTPVGRELIQLFCKDPFFSWGSRETHIRTILLLIHTGFLKKIYKVWGFPWKTENKKLRKCWSPSVQVYFNTIIPKVKHSSICLTQVLQIFWCGQLSAHPKVFVWI